MGRYDEVYDETTRRAVGQYLLDPDPVTSKRHTVPQCLKLLMAGELRYQGDKIPPPSKQPPASTMYEFKRREERRRKGEILSPLAQQALLDPETVRESIMARAVSIWDYEQERLETLHRQGKMDPRLFGQQIKNAPTVMAMLKLAIHKNKPKPQRGEGKEGEPEESTTPDELESLVQAHEGTRTGVAA